MTRHSLRRAVFLDRDGVINGCDVRDGKPYAPRDPRDFYLLPGVVDAVRGLKNAGLLVIVVTNQPDIGNKLVDAGVIGLMHDELRSLLPVDDIMVCPHSQGAGCACRKPKPGMFLEAAGKWMIDLKKSFMVGDRWSDIVAGQVVGCYSIIIGSGYGELQQTIADNTAESLGVAARLILSLVQ